jgi:hypothetical protein
MGSTEVEPVQDTAIGSRWESVLSAAQGKSVLNEKCLQCQKHATPKEGCSNHEVHEEHEGDVDLSMT